MIGYFLLIFLTIAAWALIFVGNKYKKDGVFTIGIVLAIAFTAIAIATSALLLTSTYEADSFKKNRDYHQELVNSVSDDMSPITIAIIIFDAKSINDRIENNKKHYGSKMWGFMSNEGIAETEPIKIPKYKFSVEVEE